MSTQTITAAPPRVRATQRVALRCAGLVKRFVDVTAVNGLDLEVYAGECFGLLGPNGAGKTTTVEILEGLTPADEGTVELLGQNWTSGDNRALRERIGVQLQETQLAEKVTVVETPRL
ncbi:MAG TPA: ATP-binding cassette domain-containing protein, partial [Pyrinomonadaceae bacterium]